MSSSPSHFCWAKITSPKKDLTPLIMKCMNIYVYILLIIKDIYTIKDTYIIKRENSEPRNGTNSNMLIIKVTPVAAAEHQIWFWAPWHQWAQLSLHTDRAALEVSFLWPQAQDHTVIPLQATEGLMCWPQWFGEGQVYLSVYELPVLPWVPGP